MATQEDDMGGVFVFLLIASGAWYFGAFDRWSYTYRAEVGYYQDGQQTWFVGPDQDYEGCIAEARGRFTGINIASPNRAFSWACRKMQGERFLERVR
jgi:hypothetical protein